MKLLFAINSTEGKNRELVTCSALFQGRVQSVFLPAKNVHVDFAAISLISTHYKCMNMYRSCFINLFTYDIIDIIDNFEYQKRDRLIYTNPFAQHLRIGPEGISRGSYGHPSLCRAPCVYAFYGTCMKGPRCNFCHLEHSSPKRKLTRQETLRADFLCLLKIRYIIF